MLSKIITQPSEPEALKWRVFHSVNFSSGEHCGFKEINIIFEIRKWNSKSLVSSRNNEKIEYCFD